MLTVTTAIGGQSKRPVDPADYGKFESLSSQPRGGLTPDGRWLAYGVNRSNRENELRIASVGSGEAKTVPFGSQATFSADSCWAAYAIGYSEAQEEELRKQKKPIQRKLGTLELTSGKMATVDGIETFAFNASGSHLAMKRYAPERKDAPDAAEPADEVRMGATLIVRHLDTGRDTTFGNVTEFAWQEKGPPRARDWRGRQDGKRCPTLRPRHWLAAGARFRTSHLRGLDVAQGCRRSLRASQRG